MPDYWQNKPGTHLKQRSGNEPQTFHEQALLKTGLVKAAGTGHEQVAPGSTAPAAVLLSHKAFPGGPNSSWGNSSRKLKLETSRSNPETNWEFIIEKRKRKRKKKTTLVNIKCSGSKWGKSPKINMKSRHCSVDLSSSQSEHKD